MHIGRSIIIPAILALGLLRDDGHAPAPRRVIPRADLAPLRSDITTIARAPRVWRVSSAAFVRFGLTGNRRVTGQLVGL